MPGNACSGLSFLHPSIQTNLMSSSITRITVNNLLLFILLSHHLLIAQRFSKPNYGVKSHPTLSVEYIELSGSSAIVELMVKNEHPQGWFCRDEHVFLKNRTTKHPIISSENIPVCPDKHFFATTGEKLTFRLIFPPVDTAIQYIDLIEDCDESCFYIKGIVLSKMGNEWLNEGFRAYSEQKPELAIHYFLRFLKQYPDYPWGFVHYAIIECYADLRNWAKAGEWFSKIQGSSLHDKTAILGKIRLKNYFSRLHK
jgi:hypothetical protein